MALFLGHVHASWSLKKLVSHDSWEWPSARAPTKWQISHIIGGSLTVVHQYNSVRCDQWHSRKLWFWAFSGYNFYRSRHLFLVNNCCSNFFWWNVVNMVFSSFLSSSKFAYILDRHPSEWWSHQNLIATAPVDVTIFCCCCRRYVCAFLPFGHLIHRLFRHNGLLWGVQYFPLSIQGMWWKGCLQFECLS